MDSPTVLVSNINIFLLFILLCSTNSSNYTQIWLLSFIENIHILAILMYSIIQIYFYYLWYTNYIWLCFCWRLRDRWIDGMTVWRFGGLVDWLHQINRKKQSVFYDTIGYTLAIIHKYNPLISLLSSITHTINVVSKLKPTQQLTWYLSPKLVLS